MERYHVIDEITGWFHKFHAISVRDENTRSIVEKLTGTMPESHLDPVLIYDFLLKEDIPKAVKEKDYLLLYGYSGRFTKAECSAIRSYAKEKNLKILYIGGVQQCYGRFIDCSPFEVLAYFKNATAVVTDTFHGSIFSIITHSNFAVFIRSAGYGNAEKVRDLLRRLKLENRIITEMQGIDSVLSVFPVYEETDRIIENERTKAYKYLQEEVYLCTQN